MGAEVSDLSRHRYLVVEDEPIARDLLVRILRIFGAHMIDSAADGLAALQLVSDELTRPDVILCDLNMPGMDGMEFLKQLNRLNYKGGVAVVSGADPRVLKTAAIIAEARQLNFLGVVSKPVRPQNLRAVIERYAPAAG